MRFVGSAAKTHRRSGIAGGFGLPLFFVRNGCRGTLATIAAMQIALPRRRLAPATVTRSLIPAERLSATMDCRTRYRSAPHGLDRKQFPDFVIGSPSTGSTHPTYSLVAEAWPAIAPGLSRAIHEIIQAVSGMPSDRRVSWRTTGT